MKNKNCGNRFANYIYKQMINKRFTNATYLRLLLIVFVTATLFSCNIFKRQPKPSDFFTGTIVYNVEVKTSNLTTEAVKSKRDLLGTKMTLTVFENGDIQRVYDGSVNSGYEAEYINLNENTILQKYKSNDSIYTHSASTQNMVKISDVRIPESTPVSVLDMTCKTQAIGVQEIEPSDKKRTYLTLFYSYNEAIRVDKFKYSKVNDDLWAYFMSENDGALFLKFVQDYSTHKVVYTAIKIEKGVYPTEAETTINLKLDK